MAYVCNMERVEKRNGKEAGVKQELQWDTHRVRYVRNGGRNGWELRI